MGELELVMAGAVALAGGGGAWWWFKSITARRQEAERLEAYRRGVHDAWRVLEALYGLQDATEPGSGVLTYRHTRWGRTLNYTITCDEVLAYDRARVEVTVQCARAVELRLSDTPGENELCFGGVVCSTADVFFGKRPTLVQGIADLASEGRLQTSGTELRLSGAFAPFDMARISTLCLRLACGLEGEDEWLRPEVIAVSADEDDGEGDADGECEEDAAGS